MAANVLSPAPKECPVVIIFKKFGYYLARPATRSKIYCLTT
jgi:hypothetical protein